jgi:hypothetical protein
VFSGVLHPSGHPGRYVSLLQEELPKARPKEDGTTPACCFITPPLVRVTADEAFDAFQSQTIDDKKGVLMIDVRTPDEVR